MSIDSIVNLAAGKISDLLIQEAKFLYGVENQFRSLQAQLEMMDSFLEDMETLGEGGDKRSQTAITQIRKLVYDAEDVIETYVQRNVPVDKMDAFFKRFVSLPHTHQVGSKIEDIKNRIAETMDTWKKFGEIRTDAGARRDDVQATKLVSRAGPIAFYHTGEEHVVGLEEDINKLAGLLTTDGTEIQVLSIAGMGGSGKTTLATKLFNHDSVKRHFDCIAWLTISKEWVAERILRELLRKVSGKEDETCRNEELVEKIRDYLKRCRRYLIVLDDVWTHEALAKIYDAFPKGERRIIITTRRRDLVDFLDVKSSIYKPRRLSEKESWDLFRKIALFHGENSSMDIAVLETLGKEMLKKCEGLPLAVIALAGILRKKKTIENWEKVKKAVSSWIMSEEDDVHLYGPVNKMLALSYNDLHSHLKMCFLYLAMFQEDTEIRTGRLILLWIAEGFITSKMCKEGETLEGVARDYLQELIDRCMVECASNNYKGNVKSIRVHDLVRDLCTNKAKEQVFFEMSTSQSSHSDSRESELHRTAIYCLD